MTREEFESLIEEIFDELPDRFRSAIENVGITVEEYPDAEIVRAMNLRSKHDLLGLYQGVPLTARGSWYGMQPVTPDRITLYKRNIEDHAKTPKDLRAQIYEVLIHEIGHYFGMSEEEIRQAGY